MQKTRKSLCAVILAAGSSSRFCSNKLLYKINGKPMYQYSIDLAKRLNPDCAVLVTKYPEIIKQQQNSGLILVENHETHLGQSHSMKLALLESARRTGKYFSGYLFMTGDQPYLSYESLQKLYLAWTKKGNICALSCKGERKNPVVFSAKYIDELLRVTGDTGGRSVIKNHPDELHLVEARSKIELLDIDTKDTADNLKILETRLINMNSGAEKEAVIQLWFDMWLQGKDLGIEKIFSSEAVYIESYGPVYRGCAAIKKWFAQWNEQGAVLKWDIKQFFHKRTENEDGALWETAVEWHFENSMKNRAAIDRFDGMSLVKWTRDNKICFLKEFACQMPSENVKK